MKTTTDLIQDYKILFDEGALTESEFSYLKNQLLKGGDHQYEDDSDVHQTTKEKNLAIRQKKADTVSSGIAKGIAAVIIGGILLLGIIIGKVIIEVLFFDDSGDYVTYYEDDNGDGTLDPGEWNYTEDPDGNIVDIDDDGNNFEFD